jgi:nitrite transporter NirC
VPISIPEALDAHETAAVAKATQARTSMGRYLLSSALAGAYVGIAVVLLIMVSAPLIAAQSPMAKLVQGAVFGIALTLVVFAGAELFTGNNMIMLQGFLRKKVSSVDVALVWIVSLIGNFVGALGFAAMVNASGIITAGAPAGKQTVFKAALAGIATSKHNLHGGQLFFRAVLCNMLVCLALWMAARAASDGAKLIVLWWGLLAFVSSGFEHSIANMTSLSLAALIGVGTWGDLARNLVYTVPGNIVGGGLFVGLAYGWLGSPTTSRAARLSRAVPVWTEDDLEPEPEPEPVRVAPRKPTSTKATTPKARKAPATSSARRVPAAASRSNGRGR